MSIFTTAVRCFEEVARRGSIRGASTYLNMTASAVNRQILALENELHTPLFERLPRGMRLNAEGQILLESLIRQKRDFEGALRKFGEMRGLSQGHVSIASLSYLSETLLPKFISGFLDQFPKIDFSIHSGNSEQIIKWVIDGTADIGIGFPPPQGIALSSTAEFRSHFGVIMNPSHPLANYSKIRFRDCIEHPLILPELGMESRTFAEQCGLSKWPNRRVIVETSSFPALIGLVKSGVGIGFLSEFDTIGDVAKGEIIHRQIDEKNLPQPRLCLLKKSRRTLAAAPRLVEQKLEEQLRELFSVVDSVNNADKRKKTMI